MLRRCWGSAALGAEGSIAVQVDESGEGRISLVRRESGEVRVVARSSRASLRPDDLGEGVWDAFWQSGSEQPRRVLAAAVDPRARVVHRDRDRTRVIGAYRTGGGGLSIRVVERADHFELTTLSLQDGELVLTGTLHGRGVPREMLLLGTGRGVGMSALVPAAVSPSGGQGTVTVTVPLDRIRLAEYAARSGFRVALRTPDGRVVDVAVVVADVQRRRRLSRAREAWVADPEEETGHVEEHPSARRVIRAGVADDDGVWVSVAAPRPAP